MARLNIPHVADVGKIRAAIETYPCDELAREALAKVVASEDALRALVEMQLDDHELCAVILSCVQAAKLRQNFESLLAREDSALGQVERLRAAVAALKEFVNEIAVPPPDGLSAQIRVLPEERRRFLQVLYEIGTLIDDREQIAVQTPVRFGVTRKRGIGVAAENVGIGWLALAVKNVTGKPYTRHTCDLAQALFAIPEISEDRLTGALRNTNRDWRDVQRSTGPMSS